MKKKIKRLIITELIAVIIIIIAILFKFYTNNIFFPEVKFLVLLSVLALVLLGLGVWFEKL